LEVIYNIKLKLQGERKMSETKTDRLFNGMAEIVEWIKQTAESAGGFIMEQAPLVAQEIIIFGRVKYTMLAILSLLAILAGCYAIKELMKGGHETGKETVLSLVALFGSVLGIVSFLSCIATCIKTWVAPRLYLIECLGDLIK
jgi:hypothetical protein